jgi:hypothetical protein
VLPLASALADSPHITRATPHPRAPLPWFLNESGAVTYGPCCPKDAVIGPAGASASNLIHRDSIHGGVKLAIPSAPPRDKTPTPRPEDLLSSHRPTLPLGGRPR